MKYKRLASVVALIALGASPVAAAPLQPTSKWTVNFADAQCIAMRNYGTDAAPVMLVFKPSPIGEVMQVSVMQTGSDKDIGQYDGTMAIDGARATKISVLGYAASPKTSKRRMQSINLTMAEFAPLRTAKRPSF